MSKRFLLSIVLMLTIFTLSSCTTYKFIKKEVVPPVKQLVIGFLPGIGQAALEDVKLGLKAILEALGLPFQWAESGAEAVGLKAPEKNPSEGGGNGG